MQIVVAPNSFKECLSATQVSDAISKGIKKAYPEAAIINIPMADGGEGTVEALVTATGGKIVPTPSVDALNRPIQSFYGILGDGKTAVIEMAAASGLELLQPKERNPLITSTYGTGILLKTVIEEGFTQIILGIGGSATNDGGAGMAEALGFKLQDKNGKAIKKGGASLADLQTIDTANAESLLRNVKISVACDVRNPLLGPYGASRVYGPQKGATPEMVDALETNMQHFSEMIGQKFGQNFAERPGAGAAGGLGAGLMAFCNAEIVSGFELLSQITHLEDHISSATLVFTGEGKIDAQTIFGKTVSGVSQLAKKYGVPVVALSGAVSDDLTELYNQGVSAVFAIGDQPMSLEESKNRASELLSSCSERIMRLFLASAHKLSNPNFQ